ncbi:hypothetical protein PVL29_008249 [Vitis rotundifolia]|uniref:Phytocyanin domain-containing protein n=1 Tax=Vitis rotundifolia TaxID=103349 RepID=A0AA39DXE4_VITRO|nr:hypothetical protein PVL29_008249 [Vitis rotundifolia]
MVGVGVVCVVFLILCAVMPSLATNYTMGDSAGWTMGVDYSTRTTFNYGGGHTVDEVSASDYNSTGTTTISIRKAGTHYFICGVIGHCDSRMKLVVTVELGKTTAPKGQVFDPFNSSSF